jgi:hypothetical protein
MFMIRKLSFNAVVCGTLGLMTANAIPVTMNFDQTYNTGWTVYRSSYEEQGYSLHSNFNTSYPFGGWGTEAPNFAGSAAMYNNYGTTKSALTRIDGGLFSISSIDLSELLKSGLATTINFTGYLNGDVKVSQSVTLDGVFGFQTFLLSGFDNLKTLEWTSGGSSSSLMVQFDNLQLNTADTVLAPEFTPVTVPDGGGTLVLLGLALAGLFMSSRQMMPSTVLVKK